MTFGAGIDFKEWIGRTESVSDVVMPTPYAALSATLDRPAELETLLGRSLDVIFGPDRPGDVRHSQADPSGLEQLLGTRNPVELGPGLVRTLAWWDPDGATTDGASAPDPA